jgi:hypothetical protein
MYNSGLVLQIVKLQETRFLCIYIVCLDLGDNLTMFCDVFCGIAMQSFHDTIN